MLISVSDRMEVIDRRTTADGFLATTGRVSRVGNYTYSRAELGLDGNPNEAVKIYRPEDAVFSDESMASVAHRPLTLNHPPVFVDKSNWKTYSVGHVGGKVRRDGDFLDVDMLLMDSAAIDAVEHGAMLSPGYVANVSMTPGTSPDGEKYDGIMEGPYKFNHVAVLAGATPNGRGGSLCRLGDAWPTEIPVPPKKETTPVSKTILVDGIPVKTEDADAVEAAFKKLVDNAAKAVEAKGVAETALSDAQAKAATDATVAATALADANAKIATLEATGATLTAELADARDPSKLRDAAAEYGRTVDKAKAIGATIADNASTADVKRAAVNHRLGDAAKDWTDAQVDVSFATLAASVANTDPYRQTMAARDSINVSDERTKALEEQRAHFNRPRTIAA